MFQPLVGWDSGPQTHYQAWARLIDEHGRELRAREFLDTARHCGSLPRLNRWTLRRALHFLASDPTLATRMQMLLNGSIDTFDARTLDWLDQTLLRHPKLASAVIIEFDEFECSSRALEAVPLIERLRALDLRIGLAGIGPGNLPRCREHFERIDFVRMAPHFADEIENSQTLESDFIDLIDRAHERGIRIVIPELEGEERVVEFFKRGVDLIQSDFFEHPRELLRAAVE